MSDDNDERSKGGTDAVKFRRSMKKFIDECELSGDDFRTKSLIAEGNEQDKDEDPNLKRSWLQMDSVWCDETKRFDKQWMRSVNIVFEKLEMN